MEYHKVLGEISEISKKTGVPVEDIHNFYFGRKVDYLLNNNVERASDFAMTDTIDKFVSNDEV